MSEFKQYRRSQVAELCEWEPGYDMTRVSVSASDREAGSPKAGDMIARNTKNHEDQWLVAEKYFAENFEPMTNNHTIAVAAGSVVLAYLAGAHRSKGDRK